MNYSIYLFLLRTQTVLIPLFLVVSLFNIEVVSNHIILTIFLLFIIINSMNFIDSIIKVKLGLKQLERIDNLIEGEPDYRKQLLLMSFRDYVFDLYKKKVFIETSDFEELMNSLIKLINNENTYLKLHPGELSVFFKRTCGIYTYYKAYWFKKEVCRKQIFLLNRLNLLVNNNNFNFKNFLYANILEDEYTIVNSKYDSLLRVPALNLIG